MFKKWAKHKVKSNIYCVNQFLHKKHPKNEIKKQFCLFNFLNIFDFLTSRIEKIAWWPIFKPDFYIFHNEQLRKI